MRSIYYLERYMVLAIGFVVCGAVSLFFSLAGSVLLRQSFPLPQFSPLSRVLLRQGMF